MFVTLKAAVARGRSRVFPAAVLGLFAAGVGLYMPAPAHDLGAALKFVELGGRSLALATPPSFLPMEPDPAALRFVSYDSAEAEDQSRRPREAMGAHGRFGTPGNAMRRQVEIQRANPRTADDLAALFRSNGYTLAEIRSGEPVPPLRVERVPADLGAKDGNERKALFIKALLPLVLEVNQRVLADREQLLMLVEAMRVAPTLVTDAERDWLERLARRYDGSAERLDDLVRRVDIVPPSMAIAQAGIESGWGTSFAARVGNALFGQIQPVGRHAVAVPWQPGPAMPQPFHNAGDSTEAYVMNLNTHPAYAGFRAERDQMRGRGEWPEGYRLIGQLLRYSELGPEYIRFVRQVMRENELADFDRARLSAI